MKRVGLKEEFHGEPDPNQEGGAALRDTRDEVTVEIKKGTVSFRAPSSVSDNAVIDSKYLDGFVNLTLQLENGMELDVLISEDTEGVDLRLRPPASQDPTKHDG